MAKAAKNTEAETAAPEVDPKAVENAKSKATSGVERVKQNGVTRPMSGTVTGMIWDTADQWSAHFKRPVLLNELRDAFKDHDINPGTLSTQYNHWCVFNAVTAEQRAAVRDSFKAEERAAKAAEKERIKAEKAAERAKIKAEKDAERERKKAEKKAEAEARKAEREAKKAAEKAAKEQAESEARAAAAADLGAQEELDAAKNEAEMQVIND